MASTRSHAQESQEGGTAAEHAMQPQSGTATERAERRTPSGRAVVKPNAETAQAMQAAQAERADDSMEGLVLRLAEFLTIVLQDALTAPRVRHWEAQLSADECYDVVSDHIATWSKQHVGSHFYSIPELLLHKRMWDVMTRNKSGLPKEQHFTYWCRRVAACKTTSTATGHAKADSTATEHADSTSFRALAEDILTNDLTEAQMQNPAYKLRKGKAITTEQRSLINVILRKNLGDARVAFFLFNHPVPRLLDLPLNFKERLFVPSNAPTKALLQNMLEEFMTWHASLLRSLLDHKQHPDVIMARKLSDLDQSEWQRQRRLWKKEAKQRMNYGASLAEQRDSHKRKFDDMSATEQQTLHDFDTQKAKKTYEATCAKKTPQFRGKML